MGITKSNTGMAVLLAGVVFILSAFLLAVAYRPSPVAGSVSRFAEYQSTTTSATITGFQAENLLQTGPGTLGSVVITAAAAGVINIYDATTSNINLRTGNTPTSTILKASFPASAAVGTYTFDLLVTQGLYVSVVGAMPTSTITYRQN